MADYEPLIARAVAGLENNTGENRRVLYERARSALLSQLRNVDPPLEEGDITRERQALEEAIRKIEAEASATEQVQGQAPAKAPPESRHTPLGDRGLRSFRESMAEAEGLGEASTEAHRAARESYASVSGQGSAAEPPHETHYFEPEGEAASPPSFPGATEHHEEAPAERGEAVDRAELPVYEGELPPPPPLDNLTDEVYAPPARTWGRLIAILVVLLIVLGLGAAAYWQRDTISSMLASMQTSEPAPAPAGQATQPAVQPKIADRIGPSSSTPSATTPRTTEQPEQPATAPAAAVAQKVVLYEEDPEESQGQALCWLGDLAYRDRIARPGPCARTCGPC